MSRDQGHVSPRSLATRCATRALIAVTLGAVVTMVAVVPVASIRSPAIGLSVLFVVFTVTVWTALDLILRAKVSRLNSEALAQPDVSSSSGIKRKSDCAPDRET